MFQNFVLLFYFVLFHFIIGVELLYNAVLVSGLQQSESAIVHAYLPSVDPLCEADDFQRLLRSFAL